MPSGKTHDKITYISAPIVGLTTYAITKDVQNTAIVTGLFTFSGLMFSGDLDLKSKQYYRWRQLRFIWKPYQKIFSHRSIWTHGIGIGSIIRIAYLLIWILLLGFTITLLSGFTFNIMDYYNPIIEWLKNNQEIVLYSSIGLVLGETSHTGADVIVSWFKRQKRLRLNSSRSTAMRRMDRRRKY